MVTTTVLLKTPTILQLASNLQTHSVFDHCTLRWEEDSLFVTVLGSEMHYRVPALQNQKWLQECLLRSPVKKVYLDPVMNEGEFIAWAEICHATGKKVYLKMPPTDDLPQSQKPRLWGIKRLADWLVSLCLLVILSPLFLFIALLIQVDSPGPILFQHWRVGYQGGLFKIYKFRSMQVGSQSRFHEVMREQSGFHRLEHDPRVTRVGRWLRKFNLDRLPQLVNVLRGEMSLVGPKPWTIYNAARIKLELRGRLNALPGITGAWQVSEQTNESELYTVASRDLAYLQRWSLLKDMGILLLVIPKVFFGSEVS